MKEVKENFINYIETKINKNLNLRGYLDTSLDAAIFNCLKNQPSNQNIDEKDFYHSIFTEWSLDFNVVLRFYHKTPNMLSTLNQVDFQMSNYELEGKDLLEEIKQKLV